MVFKRLAVFGAALLFSTSQVHSSTSGADSEELVIVQEVFQGTQLWESRGEGTFCDKYLTTALDFEITLDDILLSFLDDGRIHFDFAFSTGSIDIDFTRKGGVLCTEALAGATVEFDALSAGVFLLPIEEGADNAKFRIQKFQVNGLEFNDLYIGAAGVSMGAGLPGFANKWIEDNLNKAIANFLNTELSERLTDFLTEEVIERIRGVKEQQEVPELITP